jgi:hypothetical protein
VALPNEINNNAATDAAHKAVTANEPVRNADRNTNAGSHQTVDHTTVAGKTVASRTDPTALKVAGNEGMGDGTVATEIGHDVAVTNGTGVERPQARGAGAAALTSAETPAS